MDEEEKYSLNLEKIYVHNVYESISTQYDEFFKSTQLIKEKQFLNRKQTPNETPIGLNDLKNLNRRKNLVKLNAQNAVDCSNTKTSLKKPDLQKYKAWPKVRQFIMQQESNCFMLDVGCGEGKYLNLNSNIMALGCDRSSSLCNLASSKDSIKSQNQVLICDNLALPCRYS